MKTNTIVAPMGFNQKIQVIKKSHGFIGNRLSYLTSILNKSLLYYFCIIINSSVHMANSKHHCEMTYTIFFI